MEARCQELLVDELVLDLEALVPLEDLEDGHQDGLESIPLVPLAYVVGCVAMEGRLSLVVLEWQLRWLRQRL